MLLQVMGSRNSPLPDFLKADCPFSMRTSEDLIPMRIVLGPRPQAGRAYLSLAKAEMARKVAATKPAGSGNLSPGLPRGAGCTRQTAAQTAKGSIGFPNRCHDCVILLPTVR